MPNFWSTKLIELAPSLKCETARNTASSTVFKPEWVSFVAHCQIRALMALFWFWVPPWRQGVRRFLSLRSSKGLIDGISNSPGKRMAMLVISCSHGLIPLIATPGILSLWTKAIFRTVISWLGVMPYSHDSIFHVFNVVGVVSNCPLIADLKLVNSIVSLPAPPVGLPSSRWLCPSLFFREKSHEPRRFWTWPIHSSFLTSLSP